MLDEHSEKTLKRLSLSEEELDHLIEECIDSGWHISEYQIKDKLFCAPNDSRINWCAEWLTYKDKIIPHWINRPYEEVTK